MFVLYLYMLFKFFIVNNIDLLSVKPVKETDSKDDDLALGVEGKHSLFYNIGFGHTETQANCISE